MKVRTYFGQVVNHISYKVVVLACSPRRRRERREALGLSPAGAVARLAGCTRRLLLLFSLSCCPLEIGAEATNVCWFSRCCCFAGEEERRERERRRGDQRLLAVLAGTAAALLLGLTGNETREEDEGISPTGGAGVCWSLVADLSGWLRLLRCWPPVKRGEKEEGRRL
ncbi:hypothetical protein KY285_010553 [Solanum tuberosum]|nr:hypothetical protein KY289_013064 [Solanum tuberosum]KAH0734846.1 hypothetical protein KY285_010553 [Solanum tuberosum]